MCEFMVDMEVVMEHDEVLDVFFGLVHFISLVDSTGATRQSGTSESAIPFEFPEILQAYSQIDVCGGLRCCVKRVSDR
jgi:hypothetical protein